MTANWINAARGVTTKVRDDGRHGDRTRQVDGGTRQGRLRVVLARRDLTPADTIPGIGPIAATAIAVSVETFAKATRLRRLVGLVPKTDVGRWQAEARCHFTHMRTNATASAHHR